jgi:hypothetical protein
MGNFNRIVNVNVLLLGKTAPPSALMIAAIVHDPGLIFVREGATSIRTVKPALVQTQPVLMGNHFFRTALVTVRTRG